MARSCWAARCSAVCRCLVSSLILAPASSWKQEGSGSDVQRNGRPDVQPYQVADDYFRSGLNGQVEGGELGRVLDPGVDVSLDANEEQHAFNV